MTEPTGDQLMAMSDAEFAAFIRASGIVTLSDRGDCADQRAEAFVIALFSGSLLLGIALGLGLAQMSGWLVTAAAVGVLMIAASFIGAIFRLHANE